MATTASDFSLPFLVDRHEDSTVNSTVVADVFSGPGKLIAVHVNNAAASRVYLLVWNDGDPTVGATAPHCQFAVDASTEDVIFFKVQNSSGVDQGGLSFTNLSYAVTTTGGTAATGNPASTVKVNLIATDS